MNKITREQIAITGIDRTELYDVEWYYILTRVNELKEEKGSIDFNRFITRYTYFNTFYEWELIKDEVKQNENRAFYDKTIWTRRIF